MFWGGELLRMIFLDQIWACSDQLSALTMTFKKTHIMN